MHRVQRISVALGALVSLAVFSGCADEKTVIVEPPRGRQPEVHAPAGNAVEAIKAYGFEQRDLAVNNLQGVLADLDRRTRDFRARSKSIASDSREDWNETLTKLEKTRDELEVNVTRMKFATADTWDDVKATAIKRLDEVEELLADLQETARE
jgi:hypothetical protein